MINFLKYSTLGILFGSLVGFFHVESSFIVKQIIIVLIFTLLFWIYNIFILKKREIDKLYFSLATFLIFFCFYNVYIFSFVKNNIKDIDYNYFGSVRVLNKYTKDNTVRFELLDSQNKKYILSQNELWINKDLQNKNIGDYFCIDSQSKNKYNIYDYKNNNSKSFDLALYYVGQGFDYYITDFTVKDNSKCEGLVNNKNDIYSNMSFMNKIYIIKNHISSYLLDKFRSNLLKAGVTHYDSSIIMAMSWGDETLLTKNTEDDFRSSGLSHILVLSGFNLVIIMSFIFFIFKGVSLRKRIIVSILLLFVFMIVANTSSPVWRAFIMSLYGLAAYYFFKRENMEYALWSSIFILSLVSPLGLLFDISLHLSFLATLGIVYFYNVFKNIFIPLENNYSSVKVALYSSLLLIFSVSVTTIPYLIYQFSTYNFYSLFFNFIVSFIVPIITVLSVLLTVFYIPIFSDVIYYILSMFLKFLSYIVSISSSLSNNFVFDIDLYSLMTIYLILYVFYKYLVFKSKIK